MRCAKHTFSGRCDITPMVCCSFGGHSTPQFLQCIHKVHVAEAPVTVSRRSKNKCMPISYGHARTVNKMASVAPTLKRKADLTYFWSDLFQEFVFTSYAFIW